VLLGDGLRLFDPAILGVDVREGIELTPTRVIETPEVTHVRYRVGGRSPLTMDERIERMERAVAADGGS
jgi:hypothetical protein